MDRIRVSVPEDVASQRELWALAFGDSGAYVENFYRTYYRPERMLVLEEAGQVRAMTAWFDTRFVIPGRGEVLAAYLYAVATHPQCRNRGLAGELLAWADDHFRTLGIQAVTTVPAQPSLHTFFGTNGFRECFTHTQRAFAPVARWEETPAFGLEKVTPKEYTALREEQLAGSAHIRLPEDAVAYQAGASGLTPGGGLYRISTPQGNAILCAEGMEDNRLLVKELLCEPEVRRQVLEELPQLLPNWSGIFRVPGEDTPFGMLKWLSPEDEKAWDWSRTAYLGLAFD